MGYMTENAFNAATRSVELNTALRGRSPEQQKVIKYFYGYKPCCLSSEMKDSEYDALVQSKLTGIDFKQKALNKLGLDESQVNEIEPVFFYGYRFDSKKAYARRGKDGIWRSSAYELTWIFFSDTQIYVYKNIFNMDEEGKRESTEEYFYKDITNFAAVSDTEEVITYEGTQGCSGNVIFKRSNIDSSTFKIVVPGESFICAMQASDYAERAIQGMRAKLREKKQ